MTLVRLVRRSVTRALAHDATGLAAELAYRAFLAMVPFLVFLVAFSAMVAGLMGVGDPGGRIVDLLGETIPGNVAAILRDQLRAVLDRTQPGLISLGFAGALWAATGAMNALVKAMNRAFGVAETRPFWVGYLVSMGLTLFAATLLLAAIGLLALSRVVLGVALLPLPIVLVLLFVVAVAIYRAGVDLRLPFGSVVPGAAVFAVLWAAVTYAFSLYIASFGSYDKTYGTLGAVVVLLVWLYLVSLALVYGAELNAAIAEDRIPALVERERLRRRLPGRAA